MSDKRWWDTEDFDGVVDFAVTELYQDSRDQLISELEQGALRLIVADTLRNVHFMEIRNDRDGKQEAFNLMMDEKVEVSDGRLVRERDDARAAVLALRDGIKAMGADYWTGDESALDQAVIDTEPYEQFRKSV